MPALPAREYASMLENLDIYYVSSQDDLELLNQGLREIATHSGRYVGVDTETTGLDPINDRVRLIQLATEKTVVVIDLNAFRADTTQRSVNWHELGELKLYLEKTKRRLVIHNSSFDINFLQREGIDFRTQRIFDTMIASRLINNGTKNRNSLEEVVKRRLNLTLDKTEQKSDFSGPLSGDQIQYAAVDAAVLPMLAPVLDELLHLNAVTRQKSLHSVFELEMECVIPISLMRHQGFQFNLEKAKTLRGRLASEAERQKIAFCEALDKRLKLKKSKMRLPREADGSLNLREKTSGSIRLGTKVYAGFNPRSTKQMIEALTAAKIQLKPNAKGQLSLDQNLLAFLRPSVPLIDEYLNWKEKATLVSAVTSLIEACDADGRIHADYKQVGTETGRLSCAEPNLQQVPKEAMFRELFIAAPGKILICADFSQIELRVAAFLSREPLMIDAYNQGRDLHMETAALMTRKPYDQVTKQERTSAKICFSGDTEVLTPDGWVALGEYQGQKVAQYRLPAGVELNPRVRKPGPRYVGGGAPPWDGNCGSIDFVDPLHYDAFESDDVWRATDRNYDIVATGNHHIFYINAQGQAMKKPLSEVKAPRLFVAAGHRDRSSEGLGDIRSRVLAMVVADGSFKSSPGWVSLGFSKRKKIHRCKQLLKEAGITFNVKTYSNGDNGHTTFFSFRLNEAPWLLDYTDEEKVLKADVCLNYVDPIAYLEEAQYWDGTALAGSNRDRVRVGTTVKATADVMQAMAVTAGLPCTIHEESKPKLTNGVFYTVSYVFRAAPVWRASWAPEKQEAQTVYCVQVPSELILIRRNGKVCVQGNCNFGLLYGAGPATLRKQAMAQYGVLYTLDEARALVENFRAGYPTLFAWQKTTGEATTASLYTVSGRRRIVQGTFNDKFTTRVNTEVQGSAGDIAKKAMGLLWKEMMLASDGEAALISMVHDEIVLEVDEAKADIWSAVLKDAMESAGQHYISDVPILAEVGVGPTWAEAK